MEGNAQKAFFISVFMAFTVLGSYSVSKAIKSGSSAHFLDRTRYKIFYLLDFELKDGSPIGQSPGSNTLVYTIDSSSDAGTIKGQATVTTINNTTAYALSLRAEMKQNPESGKRYVVWLQSRTGLDTIVVGEQTNSTIPVDNFRSDRDLSSYNVIVTEEDGQNQPARPSTPLAQAQQQRLSTPPTSVPQKPTAPPAQPTDQPGQQPTTPPGQPTTPPGQPTQGQPSEGEDINAKIQSAIDAVSASNIQTYLENLTDSSAPPENDSSQSRFSGTPGNDEEAQYIKSHFESLSLETELQPFPIRGTTSNNIIGRLYGEDRNNWYLAIAHMDSTGEATPGWQVGQKAPGADDNGSGTATIMEAARAITSSGIALDKSIEFVFFSGEESGLVGSEHYVDNLPAGKNILGVINLDMIGSRGQQDCVNFHYKDGAGNNLISDEIVNVNRDFNIGLSTSSSTNEEYINRSDHWHFVRKGFLATFAFECSFSTRYHTIHDTTEFVSYSQMEKVGKAVAGALVKMSHTGLGQGLTQRTVIKDTPEVVLGEHSDTDTAPLLVIVEYNELADLDYIFETSEGPINYWQGDDIDQPFFLGLFTESSLEILTQAGYSARIIDDNTNIDVYEMYWHPHEGNQSILDEFGTVTQLTPKLFLLKYPSVAEKNKLRTGPIHQFFHVQFTTDAKPPRFKTPRITAVPTVTQDSAAAESANSFGQTVVVVFVLALIFIGGIGGFIHFRRQQQE